MPNSFTPDDTPAWIKGDLPADQPEPQAGAAPESDEQQPQPAGTAGALPEPDEASTQEIADPAESAAGPADTVSVLEPDEDVTPPPDEPDGLAADPDDLLPDAQDSNPGDPYAGNGADSVATALEQPAIDPGLAAEAAQATDLVETVVSTAVLEPDALVEVVISVEPALSEPPDSGLKAGGAPEQSAAVAGEAVEPPGEQIERQPVRVDEGQPATTPEPPVVEHLSLDSLIESLLFVADGAVPIARLAEALEVPSRDIEGALATLAENYRRRGLSLQRFRDKVQLTTSPSAAAQVERFLGLAAATPLSRAALEALAIVAYQQPVTRPQIEAVRGVNSDSVIKNLLTKGLIEESGRAEGPGRPVLYSTTLEFMQHFGLTSLSDLPPLSPVSPDNASSPERILKG